MSIRIEDLWKYATRFAFVYERNYFDNLSNLVRVQSTYIELQYRGSNSYAICDAGFVLAKDGVWEVEPLPSNRSETFKGNTRYTIDEAIFQLNDLGARPFHDNTQEFGTVVKENTPKRTRTKRKNKNKVQGSNV